MSAATPRPDYFNLSTDVLAAHLKMIVAAIESHIAQNPGAPSALQIAVQRLGIAARDFNEELFYKRP